MSKSSNRYKPAEKEVVINNDDPTLEPIRIPMPKPPPIEQIDGYGLAAEMQKFTYQQMPHKLVQIEEMIRKRNRLKSSDEITLQMIYGELTDNHAYYKDEILWIKKQIRRSYLGYWFFNNGVPTYMNGPNYCFINFWPIGNKNHPDGLADYRDRDRRWFHAFYYSLTTTTGIFKYKITYQNDNLKGTTAPLVKYMNTKKGLNDFLKKHKDSYYTEGRYEVDLGRRTLYGMVYSKYRQEGATSRAGFCNWYVTALLNAGGHGGVQSLTDDHAQKVYLNHIAVRLRSMPFFFKLVTDGSTIPKSGIHFIAPPSYKMGSLGSMSFHEHGGSITFQSSGERAYDSMTLAFIHHDEVGKQDKSQGITVDAYVRWIVCKRALVQGIYIRGYGLLTSTLGEMTKGGGKIMKDIMYDSMHEQRDDNGETKSGLMSVFFSSADGLPGFIDEYGNSIIEDPERPVKTLNGTVVDVGAKTFLLNRRRMFELEDREEELITEMRDYPLEFKESFMGSAKSSVMPVLRISKRVTDLMMTPELYKNVDFEWVNGSFGGRVKMVERLDGSGLWTGSWFPPLEQTNLIQYSEHHTGVKAYKPSWQVANKFVMGVDIAKHSTQEVMGKKKSFHSAMLFYKHDNQIDPSEGPFLKSRDQWVSNKFILSCKTRDMNKREFAEECLKVSIYYGSMVYPEMNISDIYEYFRDWGFMGYLLYDVDTFGAPRPLPGYVVSSGNVNTTKQEVWDLTEEYLKENVEYENDIEYLKECKDIGSMDEMTKFDRFAAACAALRGARSMHSKYVEFIESYENEHNFDGVKIDTYYY